MLDGISIDLKGLKQMESALLDIAKEVGAQKATGMLTSSMRKGAEKYQNSMIRNAPKSDVSRIVTTKKGKKVEIRPGFLASRIKIRASTSKGLQTRKFGKNVVSLVRVGVFKVPYIVHIEYGTRKTKANPFIRNAFTQRSKQVVHVINRQLAKRIENAQKRIARQNKTK